VKDMRLEVVAGTSHKAVSAAPETLQRSRYAGVSMRMMKRRAAETIAVMRKGSAFVTSRRDFASLSANPSKKNVLQSLVSELNFREKLLGMSLGEILRGVRS
jgi:hypothetical protein